MEGGPLNAALCFFEACARYDARSSVGPISMRVEPGEVIGLIGANGAGKSTVMKAATGLMNLASGSIAVNGHEVVPGTLPTGCAALIERPVFLERVSARDNLVVACAGRRERLDRIQELLQLVGLDPADPRYVDKYSQGMRQRLGIARVLLSKPSVLFLDEPTNGLDPEGFRWMRELVRRLSAEGSAIVISSHLLGELQWMVTDAVVLKKGEVVASDTLSALLKNYPDLESLYFEAAGRNVDD